MIAEAAGNRLLLESGGSIYVCIVHVLGSLAPIRQSMAKPYTVHAQPQGLAVIAASPTCSNDER